ncbi:MAG: N-acetylmuramoyl-L-alanine amidase [Limnochordia bacterium]|jgi:N-acetylmuramoyl-L-alanine amidase
MRTLVMALLLVSLLVCVAGASPVQVYLDGRALSSDVAPVVIDGHVLLPLRAIGQALGLLIDYRADQVELQGEDVRIQLQVGSRQAFVNGQARQLRVPPQIRDDRLVVPLAFLAEALKLSMRWDMETASLYLTGGSNVFLGAEVALVDGRTYVNIETSAPVQYETILLVDPYRLVIDLQDVNMGIEGGELPARGGMAERIRAGQFGPGVVRVVVDLASAVGYEAQPSSTPPGVIVGLNQAVEGLCWWEERGELEIITQCRPDYQLLQLVDPARLVVDINYASLTAEERQIMIDNDLIKQVRASQFLPNIVRVVFDLAQEVDMEARVDDHGLTIVFPSLAPPEELVVAESTLDEEVEEDGEVESEAAEERSLPVFVGEPTGEGLIVVIDPGHGGIDPGALGPSGTMEKDIVLDVALRLQRLLEAVGVEVLMTRTDDRYVDFPDRVRDARVDRAHIFISIHANAFRFQEAQGTETFFHPAREDSRPLAECLQEALVNSLGRIDRGVKNRRDLYVLREARIPAVLVEIAFLNHPEEEALLVTEEFRQLSAEGLFTGISQYFQKTRNRSLGPVPKEVVGQ